MVELRAVIEAALFTLCIYWILLTLFQIFSAGELLFFGLTFGAVLVFILLSLILNGRPIGATLLKWMKFRLNRRNLTYRVPGKRVKLYRKPSLIEEKLFGETDKKMLSLKSYYPEGNLNTFKEKREKYVQEHLNIENINRGNIECRGNKVFKILEIRPVNFVALKREEQQAILSDFGRLLNTGPVVMHFKIISKRSDLNAYYNHFLEQIKNESSPTVLSLAHEIGEQINTLSHYTALDHSYYIILEVEYVNSAGEDGYGEAVDILEAGADKVRSTLGRRGIEVLTHEQDNFPFNKELLFNFYNRNREREETLKERGERLGEEVKDKSLIAPRSLDFRDREVVVMDGIYLSFLLITGFPVSGVDPAFLNFFTNVGEGFDFDLITRREDKKEVREKLKRTNLYTKTNADQMGAYSTLLSKTKELIFSNEVLFSGLEGDNEFFNFLLICTISAPTFKECIKKRDWLKNHFETYNFKVKEVRLNTEEVFNLTEPTGEINEVFEENKSNVLTKGLTYFFPFTSASISQKDGILLGVDKNNSSPIIPDLFSPLMNALIIGATGFGKSFLSMMLATRLRLSGTQVFVINPIKGHEYRKLCEELGGSFIDLGPGSHDCVNILEVKPVYKVTVFGEEETIVKQTSYLSEKIEELISFFTLISGGSLSRETKDLLSPFLMEFYFKFGITEDNSSIYAGLGSELKPMPILSDLKEALDNEKEPALSSLALPLKKFTEGNLKSFNGKTNVNLDNSFCVIDLSRAIEYEDTRVLINFIVQNFIWSRIRTDRTHRKAILYEEIWKFLDNRETARTIREIFKTIRGFYGIAIAVTQNLEDLTENPYHVADGILNNTLLEFIFHVSSDEAEKIAGRYKLGDSDYAYITGAQKGEALMVSPQGHTEVKILATEHEQKLFETDGNKL